MQVSMSHSKETRDARGHMLKDTEPGHKQVKRQREETPGDGSSYGEE